MSKAPRSLTLGCKLLMARKAAGITQRLMAKKAGITFAYACRIERDINVPSIAVLKRLAKALSIEAGELL